ncbi:cell adhesion molecule CEACAM20-like [Paroedura picta]|uniref:cell adhesion molecule CEACAM20-like n=1 Tax=Paroedura picta TaxID=143630 RepID=UPI004057CA1C
MGLVQRDPSGLDPNPFCFDQNSQAAGGMATKRLLDHLKKSSQCKVLFAAATILSCSFPKVLALGQDCKESLAKPKVTPPSALILANKMLNLTCLAWGNFTSIQWLKDDHVLQPNHQLHLSEDNRTLVRTRVTQADAGTYRCEVRDVAGCSRGATAIISVAYGPDAVQISPSGTVTQLFGSPLNLTCHADSVPAAQYSWFFNDTPVDQNGSLVVIHATAWEHEGTYECWVHNPLTNLTGRAAVMVSVATGQESPSAELALIPRIISVTVIGTLAGVVLIVIAAYCFCACVWNKKSPQGTPTMSRCDNHAPGIQAKPEHKLENPPDTSSPYQELQCGDEALYEELDRAVQGQEMTAPPAQLDTSPFDACYFRSTGLAQSDMVSRICMSTMEL